MQVEEVLVATNSRLVKDLIENDHSLLPCHLCYCGSPKYWGCTPVTSHPAASEAASTAETKGVDHRKYTTKKEIRQNRGHFHRLRNRENLNHKSSIVQEISGYDHDLIPCPPCYATGLVTMNRRSEPAVPPASSYVPEPGSDGSRMSEPARCPPRRYYAKPEDVARQSVLFHSGTFLWQQTGLPSLCDDNANLEPIR